MTPDVVVGIDSSTQSCKVVAVDAATGEVRSSRSVAHPDGTEVDPRAWGAALDEAAGDTLEHCSAVSVGGQQHGLVTLDADGEPVRPALLWNDVRSAPQATRLVAEMGAGWWADADRGRAGGRDHRDQAAPGWPSTSPTAWPAPPRSPSPTTG